MTKVLVVQCSSKFGDVKENLLKLEHTLKDSIDKDEKIDLVVVPEFFATSTDYVNHVVDENGGEILDTVKKLAKHYHTNFIAGSIVRKVGNKIYNSSFALNREGEVIGIYDKIHLFNYFGGQEGTKSTPGSKICCVDFDFGKTGIAICFDIRYPLQFRDMMKLGVKMIVLPTVQIPLKYKRNSNIIDQHSNKIHINSFKTELSFDIFAYFSNNSERFSNINKL